MKLMNLLNKTEIEISNVTMRGKWSTDCIHVKVMEKIFKKEEMKEMITATKVRKMRW